MLTQADNRYMTETGPGTPMGEMFRRFWFPAFMAHELPEADGAPKRVRLLGEDLVAFRQTDGQVGLVANACPHRGASMFFGRNEENGLRCVYHGWKFDLDGSCVDMPNEPAESNFKHKIRIQSYAARERGGVVWAYMGPPALMGELPELEWSFVPAENIYIGRRLQECNYLQCIDGGIDSSHVSFLHSSAASHRAGTTDAKDPMAVDKHPHFEIAETDYGLLIGARRITAEGKHYWRMHQFMAPFFQMIPAAVGGPIAGHVWVPIDDNSTWAWSMTWDPEKPLTAERRASLESGAGIHARVDADNRPFANRDNDYLIDREAQRTTSYTGIFGIGEQDMAVQESMGSINNRTIEHLGSADTAIIFMRRRLLKLARELERGIEPLAAQRHELFRVRSLQLFLEPGEAWVEACQEPMIARSPYLPARA